MIRLLLQRLDFFILMRDTSHARVNGYLAVASRPDQRVE